MMKDLYDIATDTINPIKLKKNGEAGRFHSHPLFRSAADAGSTAIFEP